MLLLTGASGIGKSLQLKDIAAKSGGRVYLFDNFDGAPSFMPPEPDACDVVALDHLLPMNGSAAVLQEAADWCKAYGKILCVATQDRRDVESKMDIPLGSIEMLLYREGNVDCLKVIRPQDSLTFVLGPNRSGESAEESLARFHSFVQHLGAVTATPPTPDSNEPTGI